MAHLNAITPETLLALKTISNDPEQLRGFSQPELRAHWRAHFPKENLPPTPALLLHELAFKAQAEFSSGLDNETHKLIKQLSRQSTKNQSKEAPLKLHRSTDSKLRNGTRLIRHWQGVDHEVLYQDKQYHYQGNDYRSLTKIAELITGSHWSGPRFFGINKAQATV